MKITGLLYFLIGLAVALSLSGLVIDKLGQINTTLEDTRAIASEIRDSNWIMACDDIYFQATPETFTHCNN